MGEFKGIVGTIYTSESDSVDGTRWEAWFEDFNIIGTGKTEIDALRDADRMTLDMNQLCRDAITELEGGK